MTKTTSTHKNYTTLGSTYQLFLPLNLEIRIPHDDPIRLLCHFIEGMDLSSLYRTYSHLEKSQDSPQADARHPYLCEHEPYLLAQDRNRLPTGHQLYVPAGEKAYSGSCHHRKVSFPPSCPLHQGTLRPDGSIAV